MYTSAGIKHKLVFASIILLLIIVACGPDETVTKTPSSTPDVTIEILGNTHPEVRQIGIEVVRQNNCGGTAEVETQIQRSRSIAHTIEVGAGLEVNANGQIGLAGTDVELGATVASRLGYSYGMVEDISGSITLKAKEGTYMEYHVRLQEVWEVGTAKVVLNGQELVVPFSFREGFTIDLVGGKEIECSSVSIPIGTPTPTNTHVPQMGTPMPPTGTPTPVERLAGKIAFPLYQSNQKHIYLAELDGLEPTIKRLMRDASEPALSPDGSQIAFRSWNDATRGLMVMNVNGSNPRRVSRGLEDACPYWALGESLVFYSTKEGPTPRLYTVGTWEGAEKVDSVQDVMRGEEPAYGQYPAWVPSDRIVYKYFDRSGNFLGLYIMNPDGSKPMPITDHAGDTMPSVSPRGDKVAFMSDRTGKWEVYVVNIEGSVIRQLTASGDYNSGLPTWSPDERYIAFVSERGNHWAIWVMESNGSGLRKRLDLDGTLTWAERISWAP